MSLRRRSRAAPVALLVALTCAACADGDRSDSAPTDPPLATADPAASSVAGRGTAAPTPPSTVASSTATPTAAPTGAATASDDAAMDALFAELPQGFELSLPADWAVLELTSRTSPDLLAAPDADPTLGVLSCETPLWRGDGRPWVARRFSAPGEPLDDGLLTMEIVVEHEDTEQFAADTQAVASCELPPGSTVEPITDLSVPAPSTVAGVTVRATPTASAAFPSAFAIVMINDGALTKTVIFGGLDLGTDWSDFALEVALVEPVPAVEPPTSMPVSATVAASRPEPLPNEDSNS